MLISRMDVSGKPSFSLSIFTFFSAHTRPVALSLALRAGDASVCQAHGREHLGGDGSRRIYRLQTFSGRTTPNAAG